MFEFLSEVVLVMGILCGCFGLCFLFFSTAINAGNGKNSPAKIIGRIISFFVFVAIGVCLISFIEDGYHAIFGLIACIAGIIFSIYMKKKNREQDAKEQEENNGKIK